MVSSDTKDSVKVLFATMWPFLGCTLLAFVLQVSAGSTSTNIAVNTVSVVEQGDSLLITVTYSGSPDTRASWYMPYLSSKGFVNLDFEEENSYALGVGRTTARISHEEAAKQNPKIANSYLLLRSQDCEVEIGFPSFSSLRSLSPASQDFGGFSLILQRSGGRVLQPGQDLTLRKRYSFRTSINAVLSSPELPKFEIGMPIVPHTRVEREGATGGIPVRTDSYGYKAPDPVNATLTMRGWRGSATRKKSTFQLKNVEAVTGILKVWVMSVRQREGTDSLVTRFEFKQNLYVRQRRGDDVIPNNTVAMDVNRDHSLTSFDVPVNLAIPELNLMAIGNPAPTLTLRRRDDCDSDAAGSSPDVEIVETRRASKFEVNHFFRFKNATEALQGSYTVVARSGLMEVREILSIGFIR